MQSEIISYLVTFLVGALSGAAGKYLGDKYSDKRKIKEAKKASRNLFVKIQRLMPKLISEMVEDVNGEGNETIREFILLPNERVSFNSGGKMRFTYFMNKHHDLCGKIQILEQEGMIVDVTPGNTPIYRMSEEFVESLKAT